MSDPADRPTPRALVEAELRDGERLLWAGAPDPGVLFSRNDLFLIPFSLLWCGFAIFWEVSALRDDTNSWFFPVFGAFFVMMGLFLVAGRFLLKRLRKARTGYAVTDRRAFLVAGRTTHQVPATDRTTQVSWSRERSHVTVEWTGSASGGGRFGASQRGLTNTGLDGVMAPLPMAFVDVRDGAALLRALEDAGRGDLRGD
jgi:hypothetical protein